MFSNLDKWNFELLDGYSAHNKDFLALVGLHTSGDD